MPMRDATATACAAITPKVTIALATGSKIAKYVSLCG